MQIAAPALVACLLFAGQVTAAPKAPPVNIVNANADWGKDTAVCRRYVVANFVPAVKPVDERSNALVCNTAGPTTVCNDAGSTGGFAAGFAQSAAAMNKVNGVDERARLKMFYACMDEMGWRQP